jgi:hypothetical protein
VTFSVQSSWLFFIMASDDAKSGDQFGDQGQPQAGGLLPISLKPKSNPVATL